MKCPHCLENFDELQFAHTEVIGKDADGYWGIQQTTCTACRRFIVFLQYGPDAAKGPYGHPVRIEPIVMSVMVRPRGSSRPPVPPGVRVDIASDYREACLVLADSAKASAALSRRCLQSLLRERLGKRLRSLDVEIDAVLELKELPSDLGKQLDAVRLIGNFAAHPEKSEHTGEIVDVEPHEAEWNLDVLEELFDFYYVRGVRLAKRLQGLNEKLQSVGKQPLK